jgi:LmbE family N-acetylglucosaminyl deacetylase
VSAIVLSPHLDDAVLSCWHVLSSSADVVVLNVFTAIPPAGTQTPRWDRVTGSDDSADRMRQRLEEDAAALALAGRRSQNLGFVDSQYRAQPPDGLVDALRARLADDAAVIAPPAIGGHSDHELVRDAALVLADEGCDVALYGDLPYATEFGWPAWLSGGEADPFLDVDAYWAGYVPDGFEPQLVELTPEEQRTKVEAMRMYRTQFPAMEAGPLRRLMHPELLQFELLWTRASTGAGPS